MSTDKENYQKCHWLEQSEINFPEFEPKRQFFKVLGKLLISTKIFFRWEEEDQLGRYQNVLVKAIYNGKNCFLKRIIYSEQLQSDNSYYESIISVHEAKRIMEKEKRI